MSKILTLSAEARQRAGKGTARQTRRAGRIPAVIYGNKQEPVMISLDSNEFGKILAKPGFFTHLFDVAVDGTNHRVLPRDVQLDPVTDVPLHVDFLRVGSGTKITVHVPVSFINQDKSPGLKRGATLNIVLHDLALICEAGNIPEHIHVDVEGLDVGASIHLSAIKLPEGAVPASHDPDTTIATIVTPSGMKSEAGDAKA